LRRDALSSDAYYSPVCGALHLWSHPVGGFDEAAGVIQELSVGRMVGAFDPLDMGPDRRMLLGEEPGEEVLLLRGTDDQDGAGVRDRARDILEERLVLLDPVSPALIPRMKITNDVIPDQCPVRLLDIEVDDARLLVVDPDDCVKMV
jgi:hypothetical protein